ncbi:hypothetical protein CLU79DRAFT_795543 [Phycomyces nitens]|nr:hypothetical protein CLU79DRAFT_795543 [Phycomyces nitens]
MDQHEYRKRNQCEINDIQRMRQRLEKDKDEFERYYRRKNDLSLKREEDCHVYTHLLVETLRESDFEINKLKLEKNNLCEKIETLNENIEHTEQEKIAMSNSMEAKEQRFNAVVYNLQKNVETLKAGLEDKKEEHKKLMSEFYEYVKQIRATDDNLATIKTKLQAIQAKISNLSMTLKKFLNPNENQVVYFLYNCFSCNHDVLDCFLIEREDGGSGMDYAIISLLVERLITIYITKSIYDVPIYLGSNVNIPYKELSEWEPFKNSKNWSRVLRQQLCTLVANPEIVDELQYKKDELTTNLIQHLSRVFFEIDSKVVERIKTIIDLAAQVSLAMHSQDEPVKRMDIEEGVTKINPCMAAQHGSVDGATTVQLIICPPYIVNEGQNSEAVLLEGKVICMDYLVKPKTPELNVE